MIFEFIGALGQQKLGHFEVKVWQLVTESFLCFTLLDFNFAQEFAIEPVGDLDLALLSLFKVNGKPEGDVDWFSRFERAEGT